MRIGGPRGEVDSRILVVGAGGIAKAHISRLVRRSEPPLSIFVSCRNQKNFSRLNEKFKGKIHYFDSSEISKVKEGFFSGAIIASPPLSHLPYIESLYGKVSQLLVEKPAVCSAVEVENVERIVGNAGLKNPFPMVAENYDFKPITFALEKIIKSERFGKLKKINLKKCVQQKAVDWKSRCGSLFEGGIHFVSFANCLAGPPDFESAKILDWRLNESRVERGSHVQWKSQSGIDISLQYAWDTFSPSFGVGQVSSLEFERGDLLFESNGLWLQGVGVFLSDVMGNEALCDSFLHQALNKETKKTDQIISRRSLWNKSKLDLQLVLKFYDQMRGSAIQGFSEQSSNWA